MSTRAVYGFNDERSTHWAYVHHDGYPTGSAKKFQEMLTSGLIWPLPRFEADECAAGFVAANKSSPGSVRLTSGPEAHGDIEYIYLVSQVNNVLHMYAKYPDGHEFFNGPLSEFIENAQKIEDAEAEE